MDVVAEGVEEPEQWEALRQFGCASAQGYLFSRPVPAAEVPALLARPLAKQPSQSYRAGTTAVMQEGDVRAGL